MNALRTDGSLESVDDMAAFWLVRLSSPDCTPEDRYAFEAWKRQSLEHERVFERMQRRNSVADRLSADMRVQELIEQARTETRPSFWRRRGVQVAAMAASLLVIVSAGIGIGLFNVALENPVIAAIEGYETAIGERSTVSLSDGSVVTLNTNSKIEVDYSERRRTIRLVRGQGYFEVAKDIDRPFSVEVGGKRVVALGTVFDVRFDREDIVQVTLVEGRVQVENAPSQVNLDTSVAVEAAGERIELKPGERLLSFSDAAPEIAVTDTEVETSWRTGRLIFHERPLAEVVGEMNRYNTQKLVLDDDERLLEMKVSGVFNTGRTSSFVNALEVIRPLSAERSGPSELTLVWQE